METLQEDDARNDDESINSTRTPIEEPQTPPKQPNTEDDVELEVSEQMADLTIDRNQRLKSTGRKGSDRKMEGSPFPTETTTSGGSSSNQTATDFDQMGGEIEEVQAEYPTDGNIDQETILFPDKNLERDASVGIVFDSKMKLHELKSGHVECPARILAPMDRLREEGILARCYRIQSREATREELLAGHNPSHLDFVEKGYRPDAKECSNDVYFSVHTAACARLSAGCCIQAAEYVASRKVLRSFAMIRPPGHHAECSAAMGFCFYNNVALAALKVLELGQASRILLFDWDVHHGNGIQNMLYDDPRVLYMSIHRGGNFYPNTGKVSEIGRGPGLGYNVNIPFPKKGFGDLDYLAVFSVLVEPLCQEFNPDLVLVSAGFDAAEFDPLGGMKVSPECYGHMTRKLLRFGRGKVAMALEGGYNLAAISESILSCIRVLLGEEPNSIDPSKLLRPETEKVVLNVSRQLAEFWTCMTQELVDERWDRFLDEIDSDQEKQSNDSFRSP